MALKSELEENPLAPPIEEDFLEAQLKYGERFDSEEDLREAFDVWPRCPQCGRRRITRCPICHTSADLFPLGDRDFWNTRENEEPEEHECSCGGKCENRHDEALYSDTEVNAALDGQLMPGVPSPRRMCKCQEKTSDVFDDLSDERERVSNWSEVDKVRLDDPNNATVALCSVCSEAFRPQFPKRCEWCGHDFGEGVEEDVLDSASDENGVADFIARHGDDPDDYDEPNTNRIAIVLAGLAVLGLVLVWIFSRAM